MFDIMLSIVSFYVIVCVTVTLIRVGVVLGFSPINWLSDKILSLINRKRKPVTVRVNKV